MLDVLAESYLTTQGETVLPLSRLGTPLRWGSARKPASASMQSTMVRHDFPSPFLRSSSFSFFSVSPVS